MSISQKVFYALLFFVIGIFLSSFFKIPYPTIKFFLFVIIFYIISLKLKKEKISFLFLLLLFFFLGVWRFNFSVLNLSRSKILKFKNQDIILTGIIIKEPILEQKKQKLILKPEFIIVKNRKERIKTGNILVYTKNWPSYQYGDEIEIKGKLLIPKNYPDFNFRDYLLKDRILSLVYYPKIKLLAKNKGNLFLEKLISFKKFSEKKIFDVFQKEKGSLLVAILFSDKSFLSNKQKNEINISGLSHLFAVSGLHIVILTGILINFLLFLGFSRKQSYLFSLFFIFSFVLMIGLKSSALRAAIMGTFAFSASFFGRIPVLSRILVFSLFIMLISNPFLLRYDLGFQLSFLAIFGISYLSPCFYNYIEKFSKKKINYFLNIVILTISAQIFTLPIIIYNFNIFSRVSILSNLLILPLVSYLLFFSFLFLISSLISNYLAIFFSYPVWFILSYFSKTIKFLSSFNFSFQQVKISPIFILVYYLLLLFFLRIFNKKRYLFF